MIRPLFFEFPEDRTSWTIDEAYILGENLYVAPIFSGSDSDTVGSVGYSAAGSSFVPDKTTTPRTEEMATKPDGKASLQVYIPRRDWFSPLTGEFSTGPSWSIQQHRYDSIPLLLRPWSTIVLSCGALVDFYFDDLGAWKLRNLDEVELMERARSGVEEWKARGAAYDYTSRITVLVNASRPHHTGSGEQMAALDFRLSVPDTRDDNLGQSSAEIRAQENVSGNVCVEM